MIQVFDALVYMGKQGVAHNYIRPSSIRITPDLRIVLCVCYNLLIVVLANDSS
jgi:hypothetical protein